MKKGEMEMARYKDLKHLVRVLDKLGDGYTIPYYNVAVLVRDLKNGYRIKVHNCCGTKSDYWIEVVKDDGRVMDLFFNIGNLNHLKIAIDFYYDKYRLRLIDADIA
jgi:hypothetical protein